MPALREERDLMIKCSTEIEHLKEKLLELDKKFEKYKNEDKETKRYTSTRKLTFLMIIATILGGVVGSIITFALTKIWL